VEPRRATSYEQPKPELGDRVRFRSDRLGPAFEASVVSIDAAAGCMEVEVMNAKGQGHRQKLGYPAPNDDYYYAWEQVGWSGPRHDPKETARVSTANDHVKFGTSGALSTEKTADVHQTAALNLIDVLSLKLLAAVIINLSGKDLRRASEVSRHWFTAAMDEDSWVTRCDMKFPSICKRCTGTYRCFSVGARMLCILVIDTVNSSCFYILTPFNILR
jgi:hypothetical protein